MNLRIARKIWKHTVGYTKRKKQYPRHLYCKAAMRISIDEFSYWLEEGHKRLVLALTDKHKKRKANKHKKRKANTR